MRFSTFLESAPSRPRNLSRRALKDYVGLWAERRTNRRFDHRSALFLDRDGVIVEEVHYLCRADKVSMIDGVAPAIARANRSGVPVVLVTNQAGIARGRFDWSGFQAVQAVMLNALAEAHAHLDLILACAYHQDGIGRYRIQDHAWRKPRSGMFEEAIAMLSLDAAQSLIVGDKLSDLKAGYGAGLGFGALTLTGHGRDEIDTTLAWAAGLTQSEIFQSTVVASADLAIMEWLDKQGATL